MAEKRVYSRFRNPGWRVVGGISLAGAMGIVLSIWTQEVQVAAQITPTSQLAPTPGARVVTDKNRQGHGARARLNRYETTPPPLEELKDRAAKRAAGSGPIPEQGATASAPGLLSGYGYNPYLGTTFSGTPNTQSRTFDGVVDGQAAAGAYVAIDVLTSPGADFNDEANWIYDAAVVNLSTTTTSQFWSVNKAIFNATRWPDGGVARYRSVWVNPGFGWGVLIPVDTTGSPAETSHSIVADIDPSPTANTPQPDYLNALDNRRGFPHYTASQAADQEAATVAYYKGIGINPDGTGPQAFTELNTLAKFKARYGFNGGQTVYNAKYYNKGDLGIGRDMNCVFNFSRENACYVSNFAPNANGKNVFGDAAGSKQIMLNNGAPFATVAMVERDSMPTDAWNRTFFIVYLADGNIFSGKVALDNKGYNTFVPGNCMVCHGGGGTYDAATNKLKYAYFLAIRPGCVRVPEHGPD